MNNKSIKFIIVTLIAAFSAPTKLLFSIEDSKKPIYEILAEQDAKKATPKPVTPWGKKKSNEDIAKKVQQEVDRLKKEYQEYEEQYQEIKENQKKYLEAINEKSPLMEISGGANYTNTIEEIIKLTKDKLSKIKIITPNQFTPSLKDKYKYKWDNLTRIWGSDYVKRKATDPIIKEFKEFDAPNYMIVTDNPKNIKVHIVLDEDYPTIKNIENAEIFFEAIAGSNLNKTETENVSKKMDKLHYRDYKPGNIRKATKEVPAKYYVIDIEKRSFEDSQTRDIDPLGQYLKKRFMHINKNKIIQNDTKSKFIIEIYPFKDGN